MKLDRERRTDPRVEVDRPVKLQCQLTGRYYSGRTYNVSAGGAMVEVDSVSLMIPGQQLNVGIAWDTRQAIMNSRDMVKATVVRSAGLASHQVIGLQFQQRQELAIAG